ncbi:efflux RND transporter periplasmic adaptor subunit [Candidatus Latescibacterota bacterium]
MKHLNLKQLGMKHLTRRRTIVGGGVLLVAVIAVIMLGVGSGASDVATFTAEQGQFIISINTRGELKAAKSVNISVPQRVSGNLRIISIVSDGTMVKGGDFLVQFDTSEFETRVEDYQTALDNARADLASAQANIESNMKSLENSYLSQQYSYEQSKLQFEQMKYEAAARQRSEELNFKKAELALAQAQEKIDAQKLIDETSIKRYELRVRQAQTRYDAAVEQLKALTITAPRAGMVVLGKMINTSGVEEKIKVGDTPFRGMQLIQIPDMSVMLVDTQVSEVDISLVELGQQVVVTLDALEGPVFYGRITSVASLARTETGSDVKVFDAEVTIDGADSRLKPGMTAQCSIVTSSITDVVYVPLESVFAKDDTTVVYVKRRGFDETKVVTGEKNSDYIIIQNGVNAGEEVALRDPTIPLSELGIETRSNSNGGVRL